MTPEAGPERILLVRLSAIVFASPLIDAMGEGKLTRYRELCNSV